MLRLINYQGGEQLGNCLYRMANFIAFALEHDCVLYDLDFAKEGYSSWFAATCRQPILRYPRLPNLPFSAFFLQKYTRKIFRHLTHYGVINIPELNHSEKDLCFTAHELAALGSGTFSIYRVRLCVRDLVLKHADSLRQYLMPKEKIRLTVETLHRQLRQGFDLAVGVHIRLGDFKEWMEGRFFFPVEVYARIMGNVSAQMSDKKIKFIVFGNGDKSVTIDAFKGLNVDCVCGTPVEDLYHLSLCDLMIGTMHSSFSGWASFFGQVPLLRVHDENQPVSLGDFRAVESLH